MASSTRPTSVGELEMTLSTWLVAVCCSSDSVSSRVRACTSSNSRVFSMAMTAWSAKVLSRPICVHQIHLALGELRRLPLSVTHLCALAPQQCCGTLPFSQYRARHNLDL